MIDRPPFWPWSSFRARNEYAHLDDADLASLPHELDPYERLVIRWMFASWKAALLIPIGAAVGWLIEWVSGGRVMP